MKTTILIFAMTLPSTGLATNLSNPNALADMMRAMLNMMQTFQLYQNTSANLGNISTQPMQWASQPGYPLQSFNPQQMLPNQLKQDLTQPEIRIPQLEDIEGEWRNESNIRLGIKQKYGRMYWSDKQYKNYYLEILPPRLRFTDADNGQVQEFQLDMKNGQLILRDPSGKITRFQRMP